jgi:predicted nucleic acid-binding protein
MTLVDTNVLLDILNNNPQWAAWSIASLRNRAAHGTLLINEIVYSELAANVPTQAALDEAIRTMRIRMERTPEPALFLAGVAFRRYRRSGGVRTGVLPDFFIGAHAQVARTPLLTRDRARYRTYFPDVTLITPTRT